MGVTYYQIILKGNHSAGVLYAPENWSRPIASDAEEVKNWQSLQLELRDGPYRPFNLCTGVARVVCKEFKDLLLSFVSRDYDMEFYPVNVHSVEFGKKICYIMHFTKIFDVIDAKHTLYYGNTDIILKLKLDYSKVRHLHVFNSQPVINDLIVSKEVREAIKKEKLDYGIDFVPVFCGD